MKINVTHNTTGSKNHCKMLMLLAKEMCHEYSIPDNNFQYFLYSEGKQHFCSWITNKYGMKVTSWEFKDIDKVIATGFDIEDSAVLTALVLRTPEGKI